MERKENILCAVLSAHIKERKIENENDPLCCSVHNYFHHILFSMQYASSHCGAQIFYRFRF